MMFTGFPKVWPGFWPACKVDRSFFFLFAYQVRVARHTAY